MLKTRNTSSNWNVSPDRTLHLSCVFGREIESGRPPRNLTGLDMSWHIIQNNTVACMPGLHSSWYSLSGHSKHIQKLTSSVLSFCPVWLAFRGFKILYNWPAVGWIDGKVVKRNVNRRMKIGSDIVNFFVFYKPDDDTSKHEQLQQRGSYTSWHPPITFPRPQKLKQLIS